MQALTCDPNRCSVAHHILITTPSKRWSQEQLDLKTLCMQVFQVVAQPYNVDFEVSLLFTSNKEIQKLNWNYRDKNQPTNVLSFPSGAFDARRKPTQLPWVPLGDVVLAYEMIQQEAIQQGILFRDHLTHLLIHGFLHLLGYDHESDNQAEAMEALEVQYLQKLGIGNPYLARE